jgi:hypothetical protein
LTGEDERLLVSQKELSNEVRYATAVRTNFTFWTAVINLYSSPNIIRMLKPRMMRLAGHVARKEAKSNAYRISVEKAEGKRTLERQDVGGWTILK